MWDDVIIGEGNKGTSAFRLFEIAGDHGISHNKVSFWVSNVYLGMGMTIFKYTPEGQELSAMVLRRDSLEVIQDFLVNLLLDRVDPKRLRKAVTNALNEKYKEGRRSKIREIREALELEF